MRATRTERAGEAARERACRGVRGAKPLDEKIDRKAVNEDVYPGLEQISLVAVK